MIQLPKVKIPIKVGESEVTKPGLGRKMTACCPSSSSGWGNVIPSMFSLGKMFANCFRRRSFSSDWKISFLWECNRRAYGQLLFQSSLHLLPSNSIYWKCKWKLNFQLSASEAIEAMKILYLRGKFPYAKFQPPILKTVDLLEEHTDCPATLDTLCEGYYSGVGGPTDQVVVYSGRGRFAIFFEVSWPHLS